MPTPTQPAHTTTHETWAKHDPDTNVRRSLDVTYVDDVAQVHRDMLVALLAATGWTVTDLQHPAP